MKNKLILTLLPFVLLIPASGQVETLKPTREFPAKDNVAVHLKESAFNSNDRRSLKGEFGPLEKPQPKSERGFLKEPKTRFQQSDDSEEYTKFEVYAGYSAAKELETTRFENGVNVSAVYNFHRYMGAKFDVSASFMPNNGEFVSFQNPGGFGTIIGPFTGKHAIYNVTGGIQFKNNSNTGRLKPFLHILGGYGKHEDTVDQPCPSNALCPPSEAGFNFTGTSVVVGGGLDIRINRYIDIRAIQGDINPIFYKYNDRFSNTEQSSVYANFRLGAGIVFKF